MKITYLLIDLENGGAQRAVLDLVSAFKKEFEISVISLRPGGALKKSFVDSGVSVYFCPGLLSFFRLARLLKELQPEIVHSSLPRPNLFVRILKMRGGAFYLITSVVALNQRLDFLEKVYILLEKIFWRYSDVIIAVSPAIKEYLTLVSGVSPGVIKVIPTGVDLEKYYPVKATKHGGRKVIGSVGRLCVHKNYHMLIRAFSELEPLKKDIELRIIGKGPLSEKLRRLAKDLGLDRNIVFYGDTDVTADTYHEFDIFVLPSLSEGLPIALLEAMACALPSIVTDIPAIKGLITDGVNGLIVSPNDIQGFQKAILRLLDSQAYALELGLSARKTVEANYSFSRMLASQREIYLGFKNLSLPSS